MIELEDEERERHWVNPTGLQLWDQQRVETYFGDRGVLTAWSETYVVMAMGRKKVSRTMTRAVFNTSCLVALD